MKIIIILVVIVVVAIGLFIRQQIQRPAAPANVVSVADDDPEMVAAIKKAQSTLPAFVKELQAHSTTRRYLLVKAQFVDGSVSEHIWIADLTIDGDLFRGVLADEPKDIKHLKFKQSVNVSKSQISDWMIVENGTVKGAFTTRVLRNRMTEEQRKAHDSAFPYSFEDETAPNKMPVDTARNLADPQH